MKTITKEGTGYSPYLTIGREEWARLGGETDLHLSDEELKNLNAENEPLNLTEITEVYIPICHLLNIYISKARELHEASSCFLNNRQHKVPYIIGIAGSVAVGKSTTARVLQKVLSVWPGNLRVALVTTDGFLYPNRMLEQKNIMNLKGFPESYDIKRLINFLAEIKSGKERVAAPLYSHLQYDVLDGELQWIESPDVVIIEGVNVLQVRQQHHKKEPSVFVSDFFDFSIYVDASEENLRQWYIERFQALRKTAFVSESSYFHRYARLSDTESVKLATEIWNNINRPNLELNILPTRLRAKLILEKGSHHFVKSIKLRRT